MSIRSSAQQTHGPFALSTLTERTCRQELVTGVQKANMYNNINTTRPRSAGCVLSMPLFRTYLTGYYNSTAKHAANKRWLTRLKTEDALPVLETKIGIIMASMNFLFHGYKWAYPKSFITSTLKMSSYAWEKGFDLTFKLKCSEAFMVRPHVLHALAGMFRDAVDFGLRGNKSVKGETYTVAQLLKNKWTAEEVETIFRSKDKESIKEVIRVVLNSMAKFRDGQKNTPFGTAGDSITYLQYMLEYDKDYKIFLTSRTWGDTVYLYEMMWWESAQKNKLIVEERKAFLAFLAGK